MSETSGGKLKMMADPLKAALAAVIFCFLLGYGIYFLTEMKTLAGLVFSALSLLFLPVIYLNASTVEITEQGVVQRFLFFVRRNLSWNDIGEIGVLSDKIIDRRNKKKTGTLYIYFSANAMSEEQRHQLALRWPPFHMPFAMYNERNLHRLQVIYPAKIVFYHTGDLQ